jgi:cation diffusion facilitator family transporter
VWESAWRFVEPVPIAFGQALGVAVLGLGVNIVSAWILAAGGVHAHAHAHGDHNLRGAYLHVLADALTSILAIGALLGGWLLGWIWLDPTMGLVGAALVIAWAWTLVRDTTKVLLDREAPPAIRAAVVRALEEPGTRVDDLHLWSIGPGTYTLVVAVEAAEPKPPDDYKARLPAELGIVHPIIEVRAAG